MAIDNISPKMLKSMFIAGAKYLESKKKYVDELNVFPVPDGDTGTNMTLTILAAAKEVQKASNDDIAAIAKAISSGSLRGARGNSGVILSQLFRGFCKEIGENDLLTATVLAEAMMKGSETAYKAVMKPKEGTILTVAREAAEKAVAVAEESDDILYVMKEVIAHAQTSLDYTPELLPVLKQAGVVDSGGQGYLYVLKGAYKALEAGEDYVPEFEAVEETGGVMAGHMTLPSSSEDIKFGYCTEFIVDVREGLDSEAEALTLRDYLGTIGDSIVAVADDDIIKIHVHTNDPGLALQKGLSLGQLTNLKIDNMREEHANRLISQEMVDAASASEPEEEIVEEKDHGFVVVSVGSGLTEIFKGLGADTIVEGGQTMNPSTEDLVNAVNSIPAKAVYILPNNKNIVLAAAQVQDIVEDKEIYVIPTHTIPQGIAAMINYDADMSAEDVAEAMTEAIGDVVSGQVTFAVRDTVVDGHEINEGNILAIAEGKIKAVGPKLDDTMMRLFEEMVDEDSELVTLYYGDEVSEEEAKNMASAIEDKYEACEVEVHYGGQPLYYYIISVE